MAFVRVASYEEVPLAGKCGLAVRVGETPVALFRVPRSVPPAVLAVYDACPHQGAPLSEGYIERGRLFCPVHHWSWPVAGEADLLPRSPVVSFAVELRGGEVWVDVEQTARL